MKGGDGKYYQSDVVRSSKVNGTEFDFGKDVFTKEQLVKEEVIKRHIPVDMILGLDVEDMHMGSILPRQHMSRPKTGSYNSRRRTGSANPTKTSTNFRPATKQGNSTLQPLRIRKSQAKSNKMNDSNVMVSGEKK